MPTDVICSFGEVIEVGLLSISLFKILRTRILENCFIGKLTENIYLFNSEDHYINQKIQKQFRNSPLPDKVGQRSLHIMGTFKGTTDQLTRLVSLEY